MTDRRFKSRYGLGAGLFASALALTVAQGARAETLESALARAYNSNPTLNAQRANVRATDENVPRAKAGFRPRVNATADVTGTYRESNPDRGRASHVRAGSQSVAVQVDQTLFNGFRNENSVRQAESLVLGARETLRNNEQNVLFDGASAYMNVLRDTAILNLQRNNVEVIEEQLRQTQERFNVGEVTRTDVAQAEARLAGSRSQVSLAEANLRASIARFRQNIGVEPRQLAPGRPLDRLLPRSLDAALRIAFSEHPAILAALHGVDAAELQVRLAEGELAPTLGVSGTASYTNTNASGRGTAGAGGISSGESTSATIAARLTVPIYDGGEAAARTRQAKETAGQRRLEADSIRDEVRAAVISAWGQLEASRAQVTAAQAQVEAAETALSGVREEARVGQRTTLDVLNAQQELLNARVNLITAQRDRVVATYAVVQASGRLNSRYLGLNVAHYSPKLHFDQVKDLWHGITTPDGR
ncbi:MAG TPA: TolC family outer membrane protein [Microvirga sp.]|nr:TolC family outer membrane protein [Microvirga sp.]